MATSSKPLKRKAASGKSCIICYETGTSFPATSANCNFAHRNDVCALCWRRYVKIEVLDHAQEQVRCTQWDICGAHITHGDLKRIASKPDMEHYDWLIRCAHAAETGERECLADIVDAGGNLVTCHHFQVHDEATSGRVYVCGACGNQQCISCSVAEHSGESCEAFRHRLGKQHGAEEDETLRAFEQGYLGVEKVGMYGKEVMKKKNPKPCPRCGQMIEREGVRCANQFCSTCNAAFFGRGSVPEVGNAAHAEYCAYAKREVEDRRFKRKVRKVKGEAVDAVKAENDAMKMEAKDYKLESPVKDEEVEPKVKQEDPVPKVEESCIKEECSHEG
ncbi:uncharacterized protein LTR77_009128 [Saxophila tyrrhenica]|uniref:RING-type domain-containing protein n=1 Tax=Saxophila tyrrhenica TaxID=1690608 RepID=A0AAV9P3E4_9PEZI|nr:hypothetical protein LTR77_009128 [Saxophila tyrrhenica]